MAGKKKNIIPQDLFSPVERKSTPPEKVSAKKSENQRPKARKKASPAPKKKLIENTDILNKIPLEMEARRKKAEKAVKKMRKAAVSAVKSATKQRISRHNEPQTPPEGLIPCPSCGTRIREDATMCYSCKTPRFTCPYCKEPASGIFNQKMAVEQHVNKILKAYTLFTVALPSMPVSPIYNCSKCSNRIIICASCERALKDTAELCMGCRTRVVRTKLAFDPMEIMQKIIEYINAMKNANDMFMQAYNAAQEQNEKDKEKKS